MFGGKNKNLSYKFKAWGMSHQVAPPCDEVLKNKVRSTVTSVSSGSKHKPRSWKLVFALCPFLLLIFFSSKIYDEFYQNFYYHAQEDFYRPDYSEQGSSDHKSGGKITADDLGLSYGEATSINSGGTGPVIFKFINYLSDYSVKDKREFMKTNYVAVIKTRNIENLASKAQAIVRGLGGRVDDSYVSTQRAQINFVIPKSSLSTLKAGLNEMVSNRFIEQSESNFNLLSEKQTVEQNTVLVQEKLDARKLERQDLVDEHNSVITKWQSRIDFLANKIYTLSQMEATSTIHQQTIDAQLKTYYAEQNSRHNTIVKENKSFDKKLAKLDEEISQTNGQLDKLSVKDQDILDKTATVSGTIVFQWISVAGIIDMYVPWVWSVPITCVLLIIIWWIFHRPKDLRLP